MLPYCFKPYATFSLMRVGNTHEGGYLIETQSLWKAAQLVSLGVGDDWTFEKDFLSRKPVPVTAYDPGLTDMYLLDRAFVHLLGMLVLQKSPAEVAKSFWRLRDYGKFFQGRIAHHRIQPGYDGSASKALSSIIEAAGPDYPIFLKVALNGWEYRLLDEMARHADKICGMVIEFTGVNLRRKRIEKFIEQGPFTLVHIHGNNTLRFLDEHGDPTILEMTFVNNPREIADGPLIPHPLDRRSNPNYREVELRFDHY